MDKQSSKALSFLNWKKIKNIQNSKFISENRGKIILGSLVLLVIFFSYLYYSQNKIASLEKLKNENSLELSILKQSVNSANKIENDNRDLIEKLSNRVDNIIRKGDDIQVPSFPIQTTSTVVSAGSINSTANTINTTKTNNSYVSPTPANTTLSSQGQIEIYDDVVTNISLYQDATTLSKIVGSIKRGSVVDFYKYTSGWYGIKNPNSNELAWVMEKNVRHK